MEKYPTPITKADLTQSKAGHVFFWIFLISGLFFLYFAVVKMTGTALPLWQEARYMPFAMTFSTAVFCLATSVPLYMFYFKGVNMFSSKTIAGSLAKYALYAVLFFILIGIAESLYYL